MRAEIRIGLRYVFRHPLLRPLIWQIGIGNFFNAVVGSILIVYAVRSLHLSATTVGIVFSIGNVGLLVGAPIAGRIARALGIGPTLIAGAVLSGFAYVPFAAVSRGAAIPLLALAQFLFSFGAVLYFVNGIALIQTITPERLLGRVNASRRFAVWGVIPLGSLTGGAIASLLGLHAAIWIGAVGATLSVCPLIASAMPSIHVTEDAELLVAELNEEAALPA